MSALMNKAVIMEPFVSLSYPLVLVSKGILPPAVNAAVVKNEDGNLKFSWKDNTGVGTAKADDKVIMVAYFPSVGISVAGISESQRKDEQAVLRIATMHGYAAETWIGFVNNDESNAADSVYIAPVQL